MFSFSKCATPLSKMLSSPAQHRQSGNIFAVLFGAVALTGALAAVSMQTITGPIQTATKVTQRNMIESNLLTNSKLVVLNAATLDDSGDTDADGFIEPTGYIPNGTSGCVITLTGGGCLPSTFGASTTDPYGNPYGYCVWDHGSVDGGHADGAAASPYLLNGNLDVTSPVIAMISAGPDKTFQTSCLAFDASGTEGLQRVTGSDDLVFTYTYAEAAASTGGLWNIDEADNTTAEIDKNVQIKDGSGDVQASISTGGAGLFNELTTNVIIARDDDTIEIDASSGVGIGIASPQELLHAHNVNGVQGSAALFTNATAGVTATDGLWVGYSNAGYLWNYENTFLSLATNNIERMRILNSGEVGIGTETPVGELQLSDSGNSVLAMSSTGTGSSLLQLYTAYADTDETQGTGNPSGGNKGWQIAGNGSAAANPDNLGMNFWNGTTWTTGIQVDASGNVGIGVDTPNTKLHVVGDVYVAGNQIYFNHDDATNANNDYISYTDTNDLILPDNKGTFILYAERIQGQTDPTSATGTLAAWGGYFKSRVGIANDAPSEALDVTGTVRATNVVLTSDARFKEAIHELRANYGLDAVNKLKPVRYHWKDKEKMGDREQIGFIAQDVEKIIPELVAGTEDNKSVNYLQMVPILVKAIQDQQVIIDQQSKDIAALKASLAAQ